MGSALTGKKIFKNSFLKNLNIWVFFQWLKENKQVTFVNSVTSPPPCLSFYLKELSNEQGPASLGFSSFLLPLNLHKVEEKA